MTGSLLSLWLNLAGCKIGKHEGFTSCHPSSNNPWPSPQARESGGAGPAPLRTLADMLTVSAQECLTNVHTDDVGAIVNALIERAETIMGIPDGSM